VARAAATEAGATAAVKAVVARGVAVMAAASAAVRAGATAGVREVDLEADWEEGGWEVVDSVEA
jgi:hypothetical protein